MTTIFMEVPLDARTVREQRPNFGLRFQGSRPYPTLRIDQRMFSYRPGFALAGIEEKAKQQQACPTSTCGQ